MIKGIIFCVYLEIKVWRIFKKYLHLSIYHIWNMVIVNGNKATFFVLWESKKSTRATLRSWNWEKDHPKQKIENIRCRHLEKSHQHLNNKNKAGRCRGRGDVTTEQKWSKYFPLLFWMIRWMKKSLRWPWFSVVLNILGRLQDRPKSHVETHLV